MHNPDTTVMFRGCWAVVSTPGGPAVHVLWDDGDHSVVSLRAFKEVSGV